MRAVVFSEPGRMRFVTRNGNDVTARYPELARMNRALSMHRAVLDGEVVAFDDQGRPSFAALQGRMHLTREAQVGGWPRSAPVTYMAFDLLWLDGRSLMGLPYEERRAALRALLADGERWQVPDHVVGGGAALLAATREQGLEGVVAKRLDCPYEPGRRERRLAQGQEHQPPGARDRRLAAGRGAAPRAHRRAAGRRARGATTRRCASPGVSARGSPRPSSTASPGCLARWSAARRRSTWSARR